MAKELLETKIIDPDQTESFNKFKAKVGAIHAILIGILLTICKKEVSLDDIINTPSFITIALVFIFAIGSALLIAFVYAKVPTKGIVQFYDESLVFKLGKERITYNVVDLLKLKIIIEDSKYYIGILINKKETFLELDIVFQSEKNILHKIVQNWIAKGFNVEIKDFSDPPEEVISSMPKSIRRPGMDPRHRFSEYKVKTQVGIPFKVKTNVPYHKFSKEELFIMAVASFKSLDWGLKSILPDRITGVTDNTFQFLGNKILIEFKEKGMYISCEVYGKGIFPIGGNAQLSDFLKTMTDISANLDLESAKETYKKLIESSSYLQP